MNLHCHLQSDNLEEETCMCVKKTDGSGLFERVCGSCRLRFKFVCDDWKNKERGILRRNPRSPLFKELCVTLNKKSGQIQLTKCL